MARAIRILALFGAIALSAAAPAPRVQVGQPAPDFAMTFANGSRTTLADLRGQVVVINFWASWCVPCKAEIPLLDTYYNKRKDVGLRVFAVSAEDEDVPPALKPLFDKISYPQARTITAPYRPLGGVPTSIIIGRDGRIRYAKPGMLTLDSLNAILVPLLNEKAPATS